MLINSYNVKGLRNDTKRRDMFRYFKNRKLDVILLQETHSQVEDERIWSKEWGGEVWYAHGSTKSKGVAILVRKGVDLKVVEAQTAFEGRFLMLEVKIGEFNFLLANFYGPNEDDDSFYIQAFEKVESKDNPNMILAGDFNTTLNPELDSNCNTDSHKRKRMAIKSYLEMRDLQDIWREQNPDKYQYTWKKDRLALTSSRIDYMFVSQSLCNRVNFTDIIPGYKSDHWRLSLGLNLEAHPKGKGFWKLNVSHLKNQEFLEELNLKIDQYLWQVKEDITPAQNWEYLKLEITSFCTEYSNRKAKEKNRLIEKLENRLKILDQKLGECRDIKGKEELANKIHKTEQFLINEHEEMTQKKVEFFKAKWHNFGEKNNKFFFKPSQGQIQLQGDFQATFSYR